MSQTPADTGPLDPDPDQEPAGGTVEEPGLGRDEGRLAGEEDDGSEALEHGGGGAG